MGKLIGPTFSNTPFPCRKLGMYVYPGTQLDPFCSNYVELCRITTAIMSICRVSQNNEFSQYACIPSQYSDPFTPLPYKCCRHGPFLHIRKLTHLSAKMLIEVLDYVCRDGDEDLEEEGGGGVLRSHHVIWEVGDKFCEP